MEYLIKYSDIKEKTLKELSEYLLNRKKPLKDLLVKDLAFYDDKEIFPGVGVYIFYDDKEKRFAYVGKCSHRTFAERIPSHFDMRVGGWFNSMIKCIINKGGEKIKKNGGEDDDKRIIEQAKKCFENFSISLISFDKSDEDEKIVQLENLLRIELKPYNVLAKIIQNENKIIDLLK